MKLPILLITLVASITIAGEARPKPGPLDPQGRVHIPIGIPNTVDTLKTFVEAEGPFSPGVATYGIYVWLHDGERLHAGTMAGAQAKHGLHPEGYLIPWTSHEAGQFEVRTELCQVITGPSNDSHAVAARVTVRSRGSTDSAARLYIALRPLGPAGGPVREVAWDGENRILLADGHTAIVCSDPVPNAIGAMETDRAGEQAMVNEVPAAMSAKSASGDASALVRFDLKIPAGQAATVRLLCPVLAGRRAVGHRWDGKDPWAQLDDAIPSPPEGGLLQPDCGPCYSNLIVDALFRQAEGEWKDLVGRARITLPDARWSAAFRAITGHLAMCMNEGAPDVAVVNFNVFNRDGMYAANAFQKAGRFDLSEKAIDYFLKHPFNGRIYPETDNPGQVLWVMGEHYRFTKDRAWLARVYPSMLKLAAMVRYYRTTPPPHFVASDSLDFGDALPAAKRQKLEPGRCDGTHPEYTDAYDVAGLRAAAYLAGQFGHDAEAKEIGELAAKLFEQYDAKFGTRLPKEYGSYCVLWPCRLYPFGQGRAFEAFRGVGLQQPQGWRYFALARSHQGLLAGSREAGHATIDAHLDHSQMRGWYAFDEGGKSGAGGWRHVRTTWDSSVAMPHGWAIAEVHHLIRDSLAFEDGDRLVLLAGVPASWLERGEGIEVENLPTHFGPLSFKLAGGEVKIAMPTPPPGGFVLRLPSGDVERRRMMNDE